MISEAYQINNMKLMQKRRPGKVEDLPDWAGKDPVDQILEAPLLTISFLAFCPQLRGVSVHWQSTSFVNIYNCSFL